MAKLFEITRQTISTDDVITRLADPAIGAVATFVGVVRGETKGREVRYLEYEAYLEMAEQTLRQLGGEVRTRWPTIREVAIVHRVGRLEIGETAVVIALSAAHRGEAKDDRTDARRGGGSGARVERVPSPGTGARAHP
jgi:molybdopterin synthase catalytic subunit